MGVLGLYSLRSGRMSNMASLAPSRQWRLRDVPLAVVLLVWVAFAASVFFYFSDWFPVRHEVAVKPQMYNSSRITNDNRLYFGSIFIVPERGESCWEFGLDNRTGKMWDKGFVNCYEAISRSVAGKNLGGISSERLRAISKTFHPGGD